MSKRIDAKLTLISEKDGISINEIRETFDVKKESPQELFPVLLIQDFDRYK